MSKLRYFAATQAGDWWDVKRGHLFKRFDREEWVITGWNVDKREVYISRDNAHAVITGEDNLLVNYGLAFQ